MSARLDLIQIGGEEKEKNMALIETSRSAKIRARLNHPIIDTDGHTVELMPVYLDYVKQIGGADMVKRYQEATNARGNNRWAAMSDDERRDARATCPPWWARPARNTLDRATASIPRLLHQRMDDLGMDYTVLYPTEGLVSPPRFEDEEVRRVSCRALNAFHADIYRDLDAVKIAFKRLVNLVPRRGRVVAFDGSANVSECVEKAFCKVERYGFAEGSEWQVRDLVHRDGKTEWQVWRAGKPWLELVLPMAGEHNALNATAAAALAAGQGIDAEAIANAIVSFKSVKRRLEVRAVERGVTVIDDFAHHPTAIRETLRALRSAYPQSRLWAVLEPRSNTLRRNVFERELVDALSLADEVVLAGVFKQESIPESERLHPEAVVRALTAQGHSALLAANVEEIVAHVASGARAGDVVAILSNGGFDGIYEKLPARLAGPPAVSHSAKAVALPLA